MKIICVRHNLLNSFNIIVRMTALRRFMSGQTAYKYGKKKYLDVEDCGYKTS